MKTSALNLAIFRIALFLTILGMGFYFDVVWFAGLPKDLFFSETLLKNILPYVPVNPDAMRVVFPIFIISCVTAALGFFTRTSALIVTITGAYVLGVPQLYGKINHIQHLIWFSALLSVAPSGDALSVDAVFKAWKRADRGITETPMASKIYGLTLLFVMLLIGVLYFFPGFWKLYNGGTGWFMSDNLKWILYRKWTEIPGWAPFFRIDQYPFLYHAAGFGTIFFEISFIGLIFFPPIRPWLGIGGLLFHNSTNAFMTIPFWDLQTLYVVFFDWELILKRIGKKLFSSPLRLIYDGNCKLCRRTIALLRVLDVFGAIIYVNGLDIKALMAEKLEWLNSEALLKDMHAVKEGKVWKGFEAYQALAWRIPFLWIMAPLLYFPPVVFAGEWIYRRVADSRTCEIPVKARKTKDAEVSSNHILGMAVLIFVGGFLVLANTIQGIRKVHSWPLSVYPTFDSKVGETRHSLWIEADGANGERLKINHKKFIKKLSASRWAALRENVIRYSQPEKREKREAYLKSLWQMMMSVDPVLRSAKEVRFYAAFFTGNPDRQHENPITPELIFKINQQ